MAMALHHQHHPHPHRLRPLHFILPRQPHHGEVPDGGGEAEGGEAGAGESEWD